MESRFMGKQGQPCAFIALLVAVALPALLLAAGCELSGHYHDDNVDLQFGDTNAAGQAQAR